jgi:ribosome-binding factor A
MAEPRRAARVRDRIREELMNALRHDIRDPRLAHVVVTRVEMPDDLQLATAYIRLEIGGDNLDARKDALRALVSANGRLRRAMASGLKLRYTPELRFFYDDAPDALTRVEELLHEIKKDGGEER